MRLCKEFSVRARAIEHFVADAFPAAGDLVAVLGPDVGRHIALASERSWLWSNGIIVQDYKHNI